MKDYQRVLRMQMRQLMVQRAKVLEETEETNRRIRLMDEAMVWFPEEEDLPGPMGVESNDHADEWTIPSKKGRSEESTMLTPFQLQEMAVLSRPHSPAKDWATAQISEDRRQALEELLEEVLRLQRLVTELRRFKEGT